jgi:hypothetical protein
MRRLLNHTLQSRLNIQEIAMPSAAPAAAPAAAAEEAPAEVCSGRQVLLHLDTDHYC